LKGTFNGGNAFATDIIHWENVMAVEVDSSGGGGNSLIGFLLGAVLVAVAIIGFFMWDNYKSHTGGGAASAPTVTVTKH
jgi:hypothetical protein